MKKPSAKAKTGPKKPWAGRFTEATKPSVEAFTESVSFDKRLWREDISGSIAHARMLGRKGIITKADAERIVKGLRLIASEIESGKFAFDPALEDVHMNIEARLRKKIGPAGGRLHTARSRNDQVATDLRLYLRKEASDIVGLLKGLLRAIADKADEYIDAPMPGYTHLQKAQPVLLSHHLLAYAEMFQRDIERMEDALKRLNVMPLGSCALAGTSLPIDRNSVAKELGFSSVSRNSIDAVSDRDFVIEFASNSAIIMVHLSRWAEEIVIWATEEFGFIEMPDAYATGSSIMPQKKNPDIAELIRGKSAGAIGSLVAVLTLMKGLPLAYNRDMQEDKIHVFGSADSVKASLSIMAEMLAHIRFDRKRMLSAVADSYATATDMAEYLVGKGVPFREAHEITGRLVSYAIKKGKRLNGLSQSEMKGFSPKIGQDIYRLLTPEGSLRTRTSEGGTSLKEVKAGLKALRANIGRRAK